MCWVNGGLLPRHLLFTLRSATNGSYFSFYQNNELTVHAGRLQGNFIPALRVSYAPDRFSVLYPAKAERQKVGAHSIMLTTMIMVNLK